MPTIERLFSPSQARSALRLLALCMVVATLPSCTIFRLGKDLDVLYEGLAIVSGEIEVPAAMNPSSSAPIIVLLTQSGVPGSDASVGAASAVAETDFRLVDYRFADGKNRFNFQAPTASAQGDADATSAEAGNEARTTDYYLMAFIDLNRDFIYQPGEPAAMDREPAATNRLNTGRANWRFNHLEINAGETSRSSVPILPIAADLSSKGLQKLERTATTMGVQVDFRSARFSREAVSLGMWEPTQWFLNVGYGFYLLEPWNEDDPKPLLLLVHGVNGSPRDFEPLLSALDTDDYRVALFHYPSGLRIEDNAYMLAQTMNDLAIRSPGQRFTLIGHSMGGLIAKRFIQMQAKSQQSDLLDRFISISTPWLGHGGAGAGVEYAPVVAPAWEDLAPGSAFLERIGAFELPEAIDYTLIFSHGGNTVMMPDGNDGVVSLDSQLTPDMQDRANTFVGVSQDHVGILSSPRTVEAIRAALDRTGPPVARLNRP